MTDHMKKLQLTKADLMGYAPEDLACTQCGSVCGLRVGRVFEGKPFIMCGKNKLAREVLATIKRR